LLSHGKGTILAQVVESTWLCGRIWVWVLCMPLVWCFNCCFILHVCFGCGMWIIILCVHELAWNKCWFVGCAFAW